MQVLPDGVLSPRDPRFHGKCGYLSYIVCFIKPLFIATPFIPAVFEGLFNSKCSTIYQRMDLGECAKVHEFALRADFERSQKEKDYFYDVDVSVILSSFFSRLLCDL